MNAKRSVGRPRQYDDSAERRLLLNAAYAALRDQGRDFTIANILAGAGVSTRSFYRHFESKDALLCAMYLRDAEYAADRVAKRLANAESPIDAVRSWISEIFDLVRVQQLAERVSVIGSIAAGRAEGLEEVTTEAIRLLVAPLTTAIIQGQSDGTFAPVGAEETAHLIAAAVLHAAGLGGRHRVAVKHSDDATTAFVLRALGTNDPADK